MNVENDSGFIKMHPTDLIPKIDALLDLIEKTRLQKIDDIIKKNMTYTVKHWFGKTETVTRTYEEAEKALNTGNREHVSFEDQVDYYIYKSGYYKNQVTRLNNLKIAASIALTTTEPWIWVPVSDVCNM